MRFMDLIEKVVKSSPSKRALGQDISWEGIALSELPQFKATPFKERESQYALVICVKNEGDRLKKQLQNLKNYMIRGQFDIVISDAPSNDGSTEVDSLKNYDVACLISLEERGGLSSSLRSAFYWSIKQGYQGVLMMDGNNKDGGDALPLFYSKLQEGFDYVQGSRFVDGGRAVNTPMSRTFLIKFIHAPFFSLLCRKRLTDTTNGFRGFSRSFLLERRVGFYRASFCEYELPYFLSWIACRLKKRVVEIPVTRAYPKGQPVPTKIVGWRGYWRMLKPLVYLACAKY